MKKSIFLFFAAILCSMSVDAKVIYLKAGKWTDGGAKFGCHTWGSSDKSGFMTHVEGDIYQFETPDANTDVIFTRVAGNASGIWDKEWDRVQTKFENGKDMFTITDWKAGKWEVYTPLATYTFAKNSTIYLDFRAITTKGADIPKADKAETVYDGNAGGNVIAVTFTADVKWAEGVKFLKTAQSGWSNDIPFKLPEEGQNCAQVAADGKSYTWTTYSENCQVTVSAENGTVNGAGTFKIGTSVTLTAAPNDGYEFVNWTVGGKEVSTANPYTFTVNDNITLVANFKEAAAKTYTITTSATNGTVEGAATVVEGESVTLTATANLGYKFVNWTVGGVEVSTDNPYTFVPTEDATVVANFEQLPPETVYFVNVADWTGTINIHAWDGTAPGTEWPGNPAHKEDYQIGGHDVYSLTAAAGAYAKVIFNNKVGDAGNQTTDLDWTAGKYYVVDEWLTKEEAEEKLASGEPLGLTYNVTVPAGTNVCYIAGEMNSWSQQEMTKVDDTHYTITIVGATTAMKYKYCSGPAWDYEELNADGSPVADRTHSENDVVAKWKKVYNPNPTVDPEPDPTYDYYITGTLAGGWDPKQQGLEKDGELYKATFTELNAGEYEFKITAGDWDHQWNYSNLGAAYEEVSQGVDEEGNPNGNIKIVTEEAKNITVIFDATAGKITFEGLTEKVVVTPDVITYVLMGVKGDWTTGIALTKNETAEYGEEYVLLGQEILEGDAVKVVTLTNGGATAWCGNVDEFSVAHTFDENGNIVLAPGKYDFYFKVNNPATADDDIIYIGGEAYPVEPEVPTALDNVDTTVAPAKAIVNGQLVITKDGVQYNAQGAILK